MKSKSIAAYNQLMGGVDRSDGMIETYDCTRKSYRWFTKLGLYFLERLLLNGFYYYRRAGGSRTHQQFIMSTVDRMVRKTGIGRRKFSMPQSYLRNPVGHQHFPRRILSASANKQHPSKRCRQCSTKTLRKETTFCCPSCEGNPVLCVDPCFRLWHQ